MAYDFSGFKKKLTETGTWLSSELQSLQTGRATPVVLDTVRVDSYGSKVPIAQVANIGVEDARTLRITPWDKDSIRSIEVAIRDADLGVGVSVDDAGVRVSFPELTGETRQKLTRVVGTKLEEARVSIRQERDEVWEGIQEMQKRGELTEDEKFRLKEEMEKFTKQANTHLDEIAGRKEKELAG